MSTSTRALRPDPVVIRPVCSPDAKLATLLVEVWLVYEGEALPLTSAAENVNVLLAPIDCAATLYAMVPGLFVV